jgi:pilus assembly protein CpaB
MTLQKDRCASQPEVDRSPAAEVAPRKVQVLVASADLPIRSIVDADDVTVQTVDESAAPAGSFSDPVQVVGKVLIVPMVRSQAFSADYFASDTSGLLLASALVPGSRAVSLTLSDDLGIEKLLFPGCMVDVIATAEMDSPELGKMPVSFTLLEKVMVLAVGETSIIESDASEEGTLAGRKRPPVTLLLDPHQAELVKLAMEKGSDVDLDAQRWTTRSPSSAGQSLAGLSPTLADAERRTLEAARQRGLQEYQKRQYEMERERLGARKRATTPSSRA